ncbi:MAG: hypothetical protein HC906_01150 [Bacteroidales bacterium]|nr:hypothetical protein [Bacteroidales bacterium]
MLDVVLKRIYKELPGVIAITIHDSIMTGILTNDVEAVKLIIMEELTSFVGFQPKIKIENRPNFTFKERNKEKGGIEKTNYYDATTFIMICN